MSELLRAQFQPRCPQSLIWLSHTPPRTEPSYLPSPSKYRATGHYFDPHKPKLKPLASFLLDPLNSAFAFAPRLPNVLSSLEVF